MLHALDERGLRVAPNKPIVFEALVQFNEAAVNKANVLVGLMDAVAAGAMANANGGPKASSSALIFYKTGGTTTWSCQTSCGGCAQSGDDESRWRSRVPNAHRAMAADQFDRRRRPLLHRRAARRQATVHIFQRRTHATLRGNQERQCEYGNAQCRLFERLPIALIAVVSANR